MPSRDLQHSLAASQSLVSQAVASNATQTGANAVDTKGYESVTLLAIISSRTDGTYTFKIQDSDDGSTNWLDLAASQYIGGAVPAGLTAVGVLIQGLLDCRRYVRVVDTSTAVTTGGTIAGFVLLGHPHHRDPAV